MWLILSILCSTLIMLIFRFADQMGVKRFALIVINYVVAFALGYLVFVQGKMGWEAWMNATWWPMAFLLGACFIAGFNIIGYAIVRAGVGPITVANKLSLIVPVTYSLWMLNEPLAWKLALGLLLAVLAVYLSSKEKGMRSGLALAMAVFAISGTVDTLIKVAQNQVVGAGDFGAFCTGLFAVAGALGLPVLLWKNRNNIKPQTKSIAMGLALGIPNFGSVYFLMEALQRSSYNSSVLFPLNHIGVVVLAALSGALFFNESLKGTKRWGLICAVLALLILMYREG